jgi:hypothetical protein
MHRWARILAYWQDLRPQMFRSFALESFYGFTIAVANGLEPGRT